MLRIVSYKLREAGGNRVGAIEAVLRRTRPMLLAWWKPTAEPTSRRLGREDTDVVYGEANSSTYVAWLSRLSIRSSTNHRLPELAVWCERLAKPRGVGARDWVTRSRSQTPLPAKNAAMGTDRRRTRRPGTIRPTGIARQQTLGR